MTLSYIGVGSNLEPEKHVKAAFEELNFLGELRASKVYQCQPVGFDSHVFYNLVFELETSLSLPELQIKLKDIELKWGREIEAQKFQDRTLDLDILLYGNVVSTVKPILPRADIFHYEFVLQPLYELCPDLSIPNDGRTIRQLWDSFTPKGSLQEVPFDFG
ncbi:2-amino-4-hydroxy-6-hydroxymethyldihydropteridine diphosphokinase [Vibrio algivorus]|uniref:2-amino-4-hydroxy-6-hydroxymethyldihydropteridine diphosphokinase n=1 Tax=Vibrio algivorus TaxID=1667024 RepID=A0A557PD65_9VIBR|nr:2-amino-4-hydroxy-6-hydroxymethyldihydropteridine diphosphokinase [Vibrio algivorus]TVO38574.1 2-amino-4-hydroxy-6-hydroxymethyldihydropteridine diphosphokinase [Vibrio algivorus]